MLKAKDVMTSHVVTVGPDDTVSDVASLLTMHGISAVPVIDGGNLVGIVSEGDLIHRNELGTAARHRSRWLRFFTDPSALAAEYTKAHAGRVAGVMTKAVTTVTEDTPLADIAELLEKKRIKRVPVMRDGQVVGIVSRANLVRAIATAQSPLVGASASDSSLREQILKKLRAEPWSTVGSSDVTVTDGIVAFWGIYGSEAERGASHVLAENIPGVRSVEDHRIRNEFRYPYAGI